MSGLGDENGVEKGTGERETMKTVLTSEVRVGVTSRKLVHHAPKVTMTEWIGSVKWTILRLGLASVTKT